MVDIRPLSVKLPHLDFIKGSLLELPFVDSSIESLSSICVIEHIGLGRYGDTLDPFGSEKSARELCRVLANNGSLYISVPVDHKNITYFNAHRAFTREYVLELFGSLKLIEEKYIYGNNMFDTYEPEKGFGTGLFHFKK
jgi:SAM-dependent methyltransferase